MSSERWAWSCGTVEACRHSRVTPKASSHRRQVTRRSCASGAVSTPQCRRATSSGSAVTSELADYLGVQVQAIYDLRTDGRGPSGIRVGREIRYRVSDVRHWLDDLHEQKSSVAIPGRQV